MEAEMKSRFPVSVAALTLTAGVVLWTTTQASAHRRQSWSGKSAQDDKWSFCLTAGTLCPRIRRSDDQTSPPEPHTGL
jgi:hypothetical protein